MDRRKFLTYMGCGCCGIFLNSCSTAPITDRKQLNIIPEAKLNAQAAQIYEKIKKKGIKNPEKIENHFIFLNLFSATLYPNSSVKKVPPVWPTSRSLTFVFLSLIAAFVA